MLLRSAGGEVLFVWIGRLMQSMPSLPTSASSLLPFHQLVTIHSFLWNNTRVNYHFLRRSASNHQQQQPVLVFPPKKRIKQ